MANRKEHIRKLTKIISLMLCVSLMAVILIKPIKNTSAYMAFLSDPCVNTFTGEAIPEPPGPEIPDKPDPDPPVEKPDHNEQEKPPQPQEQTKPESPDSGDESRADVYATVLVMSIAGLAMLIIWKRKLEK